MVLVEMTGKVKNNPSAGSCRCPSGEMYSGSSLPLHLASALMIRIGIRLTDPLLIPGSEKALPVGAREKAKSGDEAGERNFFSK